MSEKIKPNPAFADFLVKFPEIQLPVTLGEDDHHTFSTENEPLAEKMIFDFITEEMDEFTEFVPCFLVGATENFVAVVWWKAELLSYEYTIATYKITGEPIKRRAIAGTRVVGETVEYMVAQISPELEIIIAEGRVKGADLDPQTRQSYVIKFLPNGEFLQLNPTLN
jgi:hypothetical protein